MQRILNQKHSKETFFYCCSKALERGGYYGLRAVMLLYLIGESVNMNREDASALYQLLITSLIFSQILGAIMGDLVLGNKKALIIGGFLQALGAFSFCFPSITAVYSGVALIVLGGGLYSPNLLSQFGKLYLNKTQLLDSGFTIFYIAINIGAFLGPMMIVFLGDMDHKYAFITAGVFMLAAVLIPLFLKDDDSREASNREILINDEPVLPAAIKVSINKRVMNIVMVMLLLGIFWTAYEIASNRLFDLEMKFGELSTLNIPASFLRGLGAIFLMPIGIIAAITWSYWYSNQIVKLTTGFIIAALSYAVLFFIPDTPVDQHFSFFLFSFLFMSIAEIHLSPIIYSTLTQYANPKYLAIVMSLASLPTKLFALLMGLFKTELQNPIVALKFGLVIMAFTGLSLLVYRLTNKKIADKNSDSIR